MFPDTNESVDVMYTRLFPALVMLSVLLAAGCVQTDDSDAANGSSTLQISSPAFSSGGAIPRRFSCQGDGISPPVKWSGVPNKAKSLALTVADPDVTSGTFIHWVVYNLSTDSEGLEADASSSLPGNAEEGRNGKGESGYKSICPPNGKHHYIFKLYALDTTLDMDNPDKKALSAAMKGHIVGEAKLKGVYDKK